MNTADTLRKAADLIAVSKHFQGGELIANGHCVVTALSVVMPGCLGARQRVDAVCALAHYLDLGRNMRVITWNDTTPKEVVVKEMRACADALDEVTG